jgi:hypothetical protein
MWHCVVALVVPNILQKHGAVIFKGQVHEECQTWEKGGDIYIYIYICCLVKEWRANGRGVDEAWCGYMVPEESHNVDLW